MRSNSFITVKCARNVNLRFFIFRAVEIGQSHYIQNAFIARGVGTVNEVGNTQFILGGL